MTQIETFDICKKVGTHLQQKTIHLPHISQLSMAAFV